MEKNNKTLMTETGRYFIDISKLIFGGVVLAGVMKVNVNLPLLLICGSLAVIMSFGVGVVIIFVANKKYK